MSSRGWIGGYCPNCLSKESRLINPAIEKDKDEKGKLVYDKVPTWCPNCEWIGKYEDLINNEEEIKNMKRTKLIERMLE